MSSLASLVRQIAGIDVAEEIAEARKRVDSARLLLVDALGQSHRFTTGDYDMKSGHISEPLVAMAEELRQLAYAIDNLDFAENCAEQQREQRPIPELSERIAPNGSRKPRRKGGRRARR